MASLIPVGLTPPTETSRSPAKQHGAERKLIFGFVLASMASAEIVPIDSQFKLIGMKNNCDGKSARPSVSRIKSPYSDLGNERFYA